MTYQAVPLNNLETFKRMPLPVALALSIIFHVVFLVAIPLLSGLLHTTRLFERPKTFQLVASPLHPSPALPVPVNAQVRKQPMPQQETKSQPRQLPGPNAIKNDRETQQENDAAIPVNENRNEPVSVPDGTHSPGSTAPVAPVAASGQPQRIGSTAELDNVGFEPVFSPKPDYPVVALEARITGYVDVDLVISDNGQVKSFSFVTIKGHPAFGVETTKVLPRWRFPPPRINGKKCSVKYIYRINFVLN